MIEAIKYTDPLWYFNLEIKNNSCPYFVDYNKLSSEEKSLINFDEKYEKLSLADASYQAFKKGIIKSDPAFSLEKNHFQNIPTIDLYRYLRKYYHLGWSIYFLIMRIIQWNNPFKELKCLLKNLSVKKVDLYSKVVDGNSNLQLVRELSDVSVIIPTLNRYQFLSNLLKNLSVQSIKPFEIIIVDQSYPREENFYKSFKHLPLKIIYQNKKGQWYARNEAIKIAKGEYLLFVDDDSKVNEDWIEQHLKCIQTFKSDISAGVSINSNKELTIEKKNYHWAEEFDTGNVLVRRKVFEIIGLFDNTFNGLRMGDTEFGLRAYLNGFISISNPKALRYHINTTSGGMREWKSFNAFKPMSFWGSRPNLGTLSLFNQYYSKKYLITFLLIRIYYSYIPGNYNNWLGKIFALVLFILLSFYWIPQLLLNNKKVKQLHPDLPNINFN